MIEGAKTYPRAANLHRAGRKLKTKAAFSVGAGRTRGWCEPTRNLAAVDLLDHANAIRLPSALLARGYKFVTVAVSEDSELSKT